MTSHDYMTPTQTMQFFFLRGNPSKRPSKFLLLDISSENLVAFNDPQVKRRYRCNIYFDPKIPAGEKNLLGIPGNHCLAAFLAQLAYTYIYAPPKYHLHLYISKLLPSYIILANLNPKNFLNEHKKTSLFRSCRMI